MLATAHAACLIGIEAHPVQVEVRLGEGLPGFDIVGLPERGVRESRIRVRAALSSIGFALPPRHLVLNLAPGDLPKTGAGLDLEHPDREFFLRTVDAWFEQAGEG